MKDKTSHVNQMTGTSWHVETLHKDEFDDRRHKSRCKWYDKNYCHYLSTKCIGSAHCMKYVENEKNNEHAIGNVTSKARQGSATMDSKVKSVNEVKCNAITLGMRITLLNVEDDDEYVVTIVRTMESHPDAENPILIDAPISRCIEKTRIGECFEINGSIVKLISIK